MILESNFWKDDLLTKAKILSKNKLQKRWSQLSLSRLEQTLMLGFYSIRKLREAAKLSDLTSSSQISLDRFSWLNKKSVTKCNWRKIDELYDLTSPASETRDLSFICDQFIHSFVFIPSFDQDSKLSAIFFASDRQRNKAVFCISIDKIIDLFMIVSNDYPNEQKWMFNPKENDYDIVSSMTKF